MTPDDRILALKKIGTLLSDSLKRGEEKVSLAKTTFDTVRYFSLLGFGLPPTITNSLARLGGSPLQSLGH